MAQPVKVQKKNLKEKCIGAENRAGPWIRVCRWRRWQELTEGGGGCRWITWRRGWRGYAFANVGPGGGFWAKNPKPCFRGSVLGVPHETAV